MFSQLASKLGLKRAIGVRRMAVENEKLRFRIWSDVFAHWKKITIVSKGIILVSSIGAITWLSAYAGKIYNVFPSFGSSEASILKVFEDGTGYQEYEAVDSLASIDRSDLHKALSIILAPRDSKQYAVIVGENGTGKSTAVRKVLASLPHPVGAVYINCPPNDKLFSLQLARLLKYEPEVDVSGGIRRYFERSNRDEKNGDLSTEPLHTFATFEESLIEAGSRYKAKHNKPLVLVVDSADVLAKKCPAFLEFLQDFAKNGADKGTIRVVFISSDGSALPLLMARSAWSRAEKPAFEVGEILSGEATQYLQGRGVPMDIAEQAVMEVTGGLFASLNDFASNHARGKDLSTIKQELEDKTATTLIDLGVQSNHNVFKEISTKGSITSSDARRNNFSKKMIEDLIHNNILAIHPNGRLTFHDRFVKMWFGRVFEAGDYK